MRYAAVRQHRSDLLSLQAGQAASLLRHTDVPTLMAALMKDASAASARARSIASGADGTAKARMGRVVSTHTTTQDGVKAMPSVPEKRAAFRHLHEGGCFVMPNPWDAGTTRYLEHAGFKALATTSSGFAYSRGKPDGGVAFLEMLAHITELAAIADVPMNADFEGGYAHQPAGVAANVKLCVATHVSGLSIEDFAGDAANPLYGLDLAVARVKAARAAIDESGADILLTARSEGFFRNQPDLAETIRRLQAYATAGADCLYAPGLTSRQEIAAVVGAVAPKPVNVLMGNPSDLTVRDLQELGVRRISVGGALARAAWGAIIRTTALIAEQGSFNGFAVAARGGEIERGFDP